MRLRDLEVPGATKICPSLAVGHVEPEGLVAADEPLGILAIQRRETAM
jgi:hypothetical protein